jgi:SAM-dependent methyltransferase
LHDTALLHATLFKENYVDRLDSNSQPLKVAEIGSYDVNGGLRSLFQGVEYVGLDMVEGPGVDLVMENSSVIPLESNSVDVVVSSSMFEHADYFWVSFLEMVRVCKPAGLVYINAPSNGDFHRYPRDSWRFYPDASLALRDWAVSNGFELVLRESFVANPGESGWSDFVAIFQKGADSESLFQPIWSSTAATNIWHHGHEEIQVQRAQMPGSLERPSLGNNLQAQLAVAEIEIESLRTEKARLEAKINGLLTSKSWMLTLPLRRVYQLLADKKL